MRVTFWGTRGSIASAGPDTQRYGGNTASVQVVGEDGTMIVLDAGTGIRRLGLSIPRDVARIDVLLSHLHMDHIQGLGFFVPLFQPDREIHLWGPPSSTLDLRTRLTRYLSPPLFPVRVRDLPSKLELHNAPHEITKIGPFEVVSAAVIHPGPTVGYRIRDGDSTLAYLPDHEPAIGTTDFPEAPEWTSGHDLAVGADLLVHDAQYLPDQRVERVGWGHSTSIEAARFAVQAGVRRLACFHHDPGRDDGAMDRLVADAAEAAPGVEVIGAREGLTLEL